MADYQSQVTKHEILGMMHVYKRRIEILLTGDFGFVKQCLPYCCILFAGTHPLCTKCKPDISELSQVYEIHSSKLLSHGIHSLPLVIWNTRLSSCHIFLYGIHMLVFKSLSASLVLQTGLFVEADQACWDALPHIIRPHREQSKTNVCCPFVFAQCQMIHRCYPIVMRPYIEHSSVSKLQ